MTHYKPGDIMTLTVDGHTVTRVIERLEIDRHPATGIRYIIEFEKGDEITLYEDELVSDTDD